MKKTGLFSTLFIIAFIGSYLFCCYLIPGWKIKLDADPMTYFFENIKHMALLKGLISLVVGLIVGAIPAAIKKPYIKIDNLLPIKWPFFYSGF